MLPDLECMVVGIFIDVEGAKHVVGVMKGDFARYEVVAIDRDEVSRAEYTINVYD
jgi:hypothetical protein